MSGEVAGPVTGARMTEDYVRSVGRLAYLWGWPLVNMHNRLSIMAKLPGPGLLGGLVPAAPPGSVGMLHDYVTPEERLVACPNQDVVYGFGILDAQRGPSVVQVPDFGDRFWVYQVVDQRTDSFVRLGAMHQTKPGLYLLAPESWDGAVPGGIAGVFRFDTRIAVCIPRVFMDDTDSDRAAIQPVINQVMAYPLGEYTGAMRTTDWRAAPIFPAGDATTGNQETQWVDPGQFFTELPAVMDEVPARAGEQALYGWLDSVLQRGAGGRPVPVPQHRTAAARWLEHPAQRRPLRHRLPVADRDGQSQHLRQHARGDYLLLPRPRLRGRAPARVTLLRGDLPVPSPAAGPGLLVADALQRASLLSPQRTEPLFAGHQEQEPAPRRRRVAGRSRCTCAPTGPSSQSSMAPGHRRPSSGSTEALDPAVMIRAMPGRSVKGRAGSPPRLVHGPVSRRLLSRVRL